MALARVQESRRRRRRRISNCLDFETAFINSKASCGRQNLSAGMVVEKAVNWLRLSRPFFQPDESD
jgi:hypothetical protein